MHRTIGSVVLLVLSSFGCLWAQETPKAEVFAGYALARVDDTQGPTAANIVQNGWNAAINFNLTKNIGIAADFGGYYGTHDGPPFTQFTCLGCPKTFPGPPVSTHLHTYLFGPQIAARMNRGTPFAHALFGGAQVNQSISASAAGFPAFTVSSSGFAFALGGGGDINFSKQFPWRVQADYLRTAYFDTSQNDFRFATGVVFRLGSR